MSTSHSGFLSGRSISSYVGTWVLSNHNSSAAPQDHADRVTRMRFQELLFSASVLGAAIALNNRRHPRNMRCTRPLFQPVAGRLSARATLCVAVCPDPFAEYANILNRYDLTSFWTSSKISRMGHARRPTRPNCGHRSVWRYLPMERDVARSNVLAATGLIR